MSEQSNGTEEVLDRIQDHALSSEDPIHEAVEALSPYSVNKTLQNLLKALKNDISADRYPVEGQRFILMAIAGNLREIEGLRSKA